MFSFIKALLASTFLLICLSLFPAKIKAASYSGVQIQIGAGASPVEKRVAQLLSERLTEMNSIPVKVAVESAIPLPLNTLNIYLGIPAHHGKLSALMTVNRIPALTGLAPGPEGFLLKFVKDKNNVVLIAAGIDDRGCLYAVGEILRQSVFKVNSLSLNDDIDIRTAPAFEIRGTQYGQSHAALNVAKARKWKPEETQRVIMDYALAGANIFSVDSDDDPMYDYIRSFGLMTLGDFHPNMSPEVKDPKLFATESIGRAGFLCLSVPEARQYMLDKCEARFKNGRYYDLIQFKGGDGGGCECDRCKPYGKPFITLSEELAKIIHKYHPNTRVYFTNQKFSNEDDNAVLEYLREKPRPWLWAWGYGPGSDATSWQPGHRQNHRMDLFRYPGFGPYGLYPMEIIRQLPPQQKLVYFNEITHWKYAQHAYIQMYPRADKNGDLPPHWSHDIYERRPDQALTMVYHRQTFFAWPRYYYRVFNDLMRYGVGDITHSSGHHDHFNQWMWQRLLWAPRQSVEQVTMDYATTWFGHEAAPEMVQAIFQLEENLEEKPGEPIDKKTGIDRYYALVKSAGAKIPAFRKKQDWLWRMYMQKAALDFYTKKSVQQQTALLKRIENQVATVSGKANVRASLKEMITWIDGISETSEMIRLRSEGERLADESDVIFGERSEGVRNLKHDFVGLGWLRRQLERAEAATPENRKELLRMITHYEDAGEGGFYDNLGTGNKAPNVEFGYPYDHGQPYVAGMLAEENRPSQRSMHFTQDEDQGVTLRYTDLDATASYKIRFTLVRPWYEPRYAVRMNQKKQSIYANDVLIARDVEVPEKMSDFFTFDIPNDLVKSGTLTIRFERSADVAHGDRVSREQWRNSGGWGTILSEAWLIKNVKK
jgi:hypothetical protein